MFIVVLLADVNNRCDTSSKVQHTDSSLYAERGLHLETYALNNIYTTRMMYI